MNFGRSAFGDGGAGAAGSQSSVPEPTSALLLAMGMIYLVASRQK
jgi:hypothetical protein